MPSAAVPNKIVRFMRVRTISQAITPGLRAELMGSVCTTTRPAGLGKTSYGFSKGCGRPDARASQQALDAMLRTSEAAEKFQDVSTGSGGETGIR